MHQNFLFSNLISKTQDFIKKIPFRFSVKKYLTKATLLYFLVFIFYLWLAIQIPYTHDDWDWGLQNGIHQLLSANINSRYAGNFFEVIMTRSYFLKSVIMAVTFWGIPWLITNLSLRFNKKKNSSEKLYIYIWSNILLLFMPTSIWQQTYGWVAGFSNFVLSALFFLIYLHIWDSIFEKKETEEISFIFDLLILIFAVVMQLFIENLTLTTLFLTVLFILIYYAQNRHFTKRQLFILLGNSIGTAIMFSSNMYQTLFNTGKAVNGYRQLTFNQNSSLINIIGGFIKSFLFDLSPSIWKDNWMLCISISIVFIIYLIRIYNLMPKVTSDILILAHIISILYFLLNPTIEYICLFSNTKMNYFNALAIWGFFFLVMLNLIIFKYYDQKNTLTALFLWILIPLVMFPMVAINTVGPRSYFTPTCFLVLFFCVMLSLVLNLESSAHVLSVTAKARYIKKFQIISLLFLCVICTFRGNAYYQIGKINKARYTTIKKAIAHNEKEIYLPKYPHKEYLWCPEPTSRERVYFFKEFYKLPQDSNLHYFATEHDK